MPKSRDAFRTISEVSEWLETPAHVLRFWESKFTQVKPVKRAGGRRYYRPGDMELLGGIKQLLHEDGMTIKGVQKVLREQGVRYVAGLSPKVDGEDDEGGMPEIIEDAPFTDVDDSQTDSVVAFRRDNAPQPTAQPDPQEPADQPDDSIVEPLSPAEPEAAPDLSEVATSDPDAVVITPDALHSLEQDTAQDLPPLPPIELDDNESDSDHHDLAAPPSPDTPYPDESPTAEPADEDGWQEAGQQDPEILDVAAASTESTDQSFDIVTPSPAVDAAFDAEAPETALETKEPPAIIAPEADGTEQTEFSEPFDPEEMPETDSMSDSSILIDDPNQGAFSFDSLASPEQPDDLTPEVPESEALAPAPAEPMDDPALEPTALDDLSEEIMPLAPLPEIEPAETDGFDGDDGPVEVVVDEPLDAGLHRALAPEADQIAEPTLPPLEADDAQPPTDGALPENELPSDATDADLSITPLDDAEPVAAPDVPLVARATGGLSLPDFAQPEDAGPEHVAPGLLALATRIQALTPDSAAAIAQHMVSLRARAANRSEDRF